MRARVCVCVCVCSSTVCKLLSHRDTNHTNGRGTTHLTPRDIRGRHGLREERERRGCGVEVNERRQCMLISNVDTRAHRNSPNAKQPPSRPRLGPQGATRDGNERGVRVLCLGLEPRCDAVHPEVVLRYILKPSLRHPHHNRYTQWPCPCYRVVCAYFVSVAPHPPPVKVVPQLFVLLFPPTTT